MKYWFNTGWIKVGEEYVWSVDGQTQFAVYDARDGHLDEMVKYVYRGELDYEGKPLLANQTIEAVSCPLTQGV